MSKIEKAHRARELLDHPEFQDAVAIIRAENVAKWQKSNLHDKEVQTQCKYMEHAINELLKQFKRVLEDGLLEEATQARNEAINQRKAKRK